MFNNVNEKIFSQASEDTNLRTQVLADKMGQFMYDLDPYEMKDQFDSLQELKNEILTQLKADFISEVSQFMKAMTQYDEDILNNEEYNDLKEIADLIEETLVHDGLDLRFVEAVKNESVGELENIFKIAEDYAQNYFEPTFLKAFENLYELKAPIYMEVINTLSKEHFVISNDDLENLNDIKEWFNDEFTEEYTLFSLIKDHNYDLGNFNIAYTEVGDSIPSDIQVDYDFKSHSLNIGVYGVDIKINGNFADTFYEFFPNGFDSLASIQEEYKEPVKQAYGLNFDTMSKTELKTFFKEHDYLTELFEDEISNLNLFENIPVRL